MTRKDYVAIASALRNEDPRRNPEFHRAQLAQWARDVRAIAQAFQSDNPRFDASRFFQACGLES